MSHPTNTLTDIHNSQPKVMLENMGTSDPECSRINGRTFTASALRNLLPRNKILPDLAIPSEVIKEYNNPDLFPGMFPGLYLLGIGTLDDKEREILISFQSQAESYLIAVFTITDHLCLWH